MQGGDDIFCHLTVLSHVIMTLCATELGGLGVAVTTLGGRALGLSAPT